MAEIKIKRSATVGSSLNYGELAIGADNLYFGNSTNTQKRIANYTDLPSNEEIQDIVGGMINITGTQTGMDFTYDDIANKLDIDFYHTHGYDNYNHWYIQGDSGDTGAETAVDSSQTVIISGGTGISTVVTDNDIEITANPVLADLSATAAYGSTGGAQYKKSGDTLFIKLG
jgi:hypothetical protein